MINTREFRIGNLLIEKNSGQIIEVINISQKRISFSGQFKSGWKAEPIPLTEEWLFRFGFASSFSSDPQNFPASKQFDLKGFKIHQPIEDVDQFIFDPLVNDYIELEFVHSIQNLYFELTKQELKLNDK